MEENKLALIVKESGLEQTKAQIILEKFTDFFKIAAEWEVKAKNLVITDATQLTEMKEAREGRLFLKAKRCEVENVRKALKEDIVREGKAIDGIANVLKALIEPIESYLEEQEKYAERMEALRKQTLANNRRDELIKYDFDCQFYDLGNMPIEQYTNLLTGAELQYKQKIEMAERAEKERIERELAEAKERERIRKENERLKKEKEAQDKIIAEHLAKEKEAMEAIKKQRAIQQAEIEAERKAKEEAEAKLKLIELQKLAEVKALAQAERKAKRAPDKVKIQEFIKMLDGLNYPVCQDKEAKEIVDYAMNGILEIVEYLNISVGGL